MKTQKLKQKLSLILLITVAITVLSGVLTLWDPLEKWQLKLTNRFYDRNEPSSEIVIVGIDEHSINPDGIGKWGTWSREVYAQAIENLEEAGAKVIALDLTFSQKSQGISEDELLAIIEENPSLQEYLLETTRYLDGVHPGDQVLANTFEKYDNIFVLGNDTVVNPKYEVITWPILDIFEGTVKTVTSLVYQDTDDVLRSVPSRVIDIENQKEIHGLATAVAEYYLGELPEGFESSLNADREMMINYSAPPYHFPMVSFAHVYGGSFDESIMDGKIILIGSVTDFIEDHITSPMSSSVSMPGVEMHANAIQTILEGNFLHEQSAGSVILMIAMLTLLLSGAVMFLGILPGVGVTILMIGGYYIISKPIFDQGLVLNLIYPTLALFGAYLITTLYKYVTEVREKQQLKGAFSKYVNKDLANKILENPEMLKLGGERRTVTVFFSDIAGFTTVSEKADPEALVAQLNEYFDVMGKIIMKNGGNLNKFEGDAIMAFWGAPLDDPSHALRAAQSALECRAALATLHQRWKQEGKPLLDFRVGLSTGEVIAGNVGSHERFDYTIMGDIVNLGARLESANKVYGSHVVISGQTSAAIQEQFELRRLDRLRVKGKDEPVDVYELIAKKGQLKPEQQKIITEFHQAIEYYRNQKFSDAEARLQEIAKVAPHDGPTQTYLERCAHFQANPPQQGWDGTWTLEHK